MKNRPVFAEQANHFGMAFIFYWVGSVTSTFIVIVLPAVSSSIGTGAIFENFTKKGQDRNKIVTDNYHNAPIEKNSVSTYLIKKRDYGNIEAENHLVIIKFEAYFQTTNPYKKESFDPNPI